MSALVSLVCAGPGEPSLITPTGALALRRARVVVCDASAQRAMLTFAPPDARVIDLRASPYDRWTLAQWVAWIEAESHVCWLDASSAESLAEPLRERGVAIERCVHGASGALSGIVVAVTRPRGQQAALIDGLASRGASCLELPAIGVIAPSDRSTLERSAALLAESDVVVFTSVNGVDAFFAAVRAQGGRWSAQRAASIGRATSERLRAHGVEPAWVASESVGESLLETLLEGLGSTRATARLLLVRAVRGREVIAEGLRGAGASVQLVFAYDTAPDPSLGRARAALEEGLIDAMTFASGSAIDAVISSLGDDAAQLLAPVSLFTIGPVTSAHAERRGLVVCAQAREPSDDAMIAAIEAHYGRALSAGRP